MIRLRRPTEDELRHLVTEGSVADLTYAPAGLTSLAEAPEGFQLDRWERPLGRADGTFEAAADAIRAWAVHRGAGLVVLSDAPPTTDAVVAMSAPLPVGHVDVVCRVVSVVDADDRFGFAYGTLPHHPERGEESFVVERSTVGDVTFRIVAVWQAHHPLARLCPPVTRRLQRSATKRYLDAMSAAVR